MRRRATGATPLTMTQRPALPRPRCGGHGNATPPPPRPWPHRT
jgi:hypothetical protein